MVRNRYYPHIYISSCLLSKTCLKLCELGRSNIWLLLLIFTSHRIGYMRQFGSVGVNFSLSRNPPKTFAVSGVNGEILKL